MSDRPPQPSPGIAPVPPGVRPTPPVRRYGAALGFGLAGLVATAVLGHQVEQWAAERDRQRFEAACRQIVGMIEQKMERYEMGLSRLQDVCTRANARPSNPVWRHWLNFVLEVRSNFPNLLMVAVAARETPPEAGSAAVPAPASEQPIRPAGTVLQVIRRSVFDGLSPDAIGPDLARETSTHPDFSRMLQRTFGWNDGRVWVVPRPDGSPSRGFWFAVPLRPDEPKELPPWRLAHESEQDAGWRRERHLRDTATGVLAAFIGGEEFLREFNPAPGQSLVSLQLYTSTNTVPEFLLNPAHAVARDPRFQVDVVMPWYAKRWTARFASTPLFEAQSLRYRAHLVWFLGVPLSLAGAGVLAWQTRNRWRQADLAEQLRLALHRQERLSRDLHDGTLQSVYGVGLALHRAQRLLERNPSGIAKPLADTTLAVQRIIGELRAFIREADPGNHVEVPLGEALAGVVHHLQPATDMQVTLEVSPGADAGLDPGLALQLLNIAREALSNSVRHSHGRTVAVHLRRNGLLLRLEVADDGVGFDPAQSPAAGRGLRNLAARVRELGGRHQWDSRPGAGTRLTVEIPLASPPTGVQQGRPNRR